ncbi:MAG TPA: hypothetical protein VGJ82_14615 [Thermoanaerobaculia bacterium]|jgi:hypothetical protein
MAHRYGDVATDIDELLEYRRRRAATGSLLSAVAAEEKKSYYGTRGEEQVRAGKYQSVLATATTFFHLSTR